MKAIKQIGQGDGQATISVEQAKAIELLGSGRSVMDCAKEAKVSRSTLYRWMREDPQFIAATNAWRNAQVKLARSRLVGLTHRAIEAVETALANGDGKLGMAMLHRMGLLEPQPIAPEEPEAVRREMESDLREQRGRVDQRERETFIDSAGYSP